MRPWLWAAAAVAVVVAVIWIAGLSPARTIAYMLPDRARVALGEQALEPLTNGHRTCTASAGRVALDRLSQRLSQAAGGGNAFKVRVVDWPLVNAFASPGECIVLTGGLLEEATGPDEVAGVLAHEMGHGIERHPEANIVRNIGAATDIMLGGSGGVLTNIGLLLAQLSYSRGAEHEADEHAVRILRGAGISHLGFVDFFKRVHSKEKDLPLANSIGSIDILRTHSPDGGAETLRRQPAVFQCNTGAGSG